MLAIEQYRQEAEALRVSRQNLAEDFRKVEDQYWSTRNSIESKEATLKKAFDEKLISHARANFKGRKKLVFERLYNFTSRNDALMYVKSNVGFYKPTDAKPDFYYIRSAKNRFNYNKSLANESDPLIKTLAERMEILNAQYNVANSKYPVNEECVGIEIEFFSDSMTKRGLTAFCRKHKIKGVHLHTDGSLSWESDDDEENENMTGWEISMVTPISRWKHEVALICQYLAANNAKINDTCGLHVHLDFRKRDQVVGRQRLIAALPYLFKMLPEERRDNHYCRYGYNYWDRGERYYAINSHAYSEHKTLEVRCHSGTTSEEKIANWVEILLNIINNSSFVDYQTMDLDFYEERDEVRKIIRDANMEEFTTKLGVTGKLYDYIISRSKRFN